MQRERGKVQAAVTAHAPRRVPVSALGGVIIEVVSRQRVYEQRLDAGDCPHCARAPGRRASSLDTVVDGNSVAEVRPLREPPSKARSRAARGPGSHLSHPRHSQAYSPTMTAHDHRDQQRQRAHGAPARGPRSKPLSASWEPAGMNYGLHCRSRDMVVEVCSAAVRCHIQREPAVGERGLLRSIVYTRHLPAPTRL
jgi:hypothetical protein